MLAQLSPPPGGVSAEAEDHLSAAGVANVEVICGDGAAGWPGRAPYDGIIVTAGACDLAPAWLSQLAPAGRLVVPLSIRGVQQCVAFARAGGHLRGVAVREAGFMPLTGVMANADVRLPVPGRPGVHVLAAPEIEVDARVVAAGLDAAGPAAAAGITAPTPEAFGSLRRWLAFGDPAPALLLYSGPAGGAPASGVPPLMEMEFRVNGTIQRSSPCVLGKSGFAVLDLASPSAAGKSGLTTAHELAARPCGKADEQARRLTELVRTWNAAGRPGADRLSLAGPS